MLFLYCACKKVARAGQPWRSLSVLGVSAAAGKKTAGQIEKKKLMNVESSSGGLQALNVE